MKYVKTVHINRETFKEAENITSSTAKSSIPGN